MKKLILFAPLALAFTVGCSKHQADAAPQKANAPLRFPVEVAEVSAKPVQYTVTAVGSVQAFEVVQVTARVPGAVEKVSFREGDTVKAGQSLAEIEPRRYRLAVDSAQAFASKAEAGRLEAEAANKRRAEVNQQNPGLIRGEELETFRTRSLTSAAESLAAKATLEQAQLNLKDAYVRASVAGVIQTRNVQTGQYVQPGTVLATLVQRDPLLLRFQVSEQEAARLQKGLVAKFRVKGDANTYDAKLVHVADAADEKSRLVAITAQVEGPQKERLRPGSFAEVEVSIGEAHPAPVIPQTAIRPSERGFLAFVVKGDKAEERILELGMRTADGSVEVRKGLDVGERLVVRGGEALRNGAAVVVK